MTVIDLANDSRTPPHDVDAEQGTLGAVLMAPHHLGDVARDRLHCGFLPACPPAHLRHAVGSG